MTKRNKIPDRWEEYSNIGNPIKGTRFICFKVPLDMRFASRLTPETLIFTPEMLLEHMKEKELKLGLVFDLTNTDRYYDGGRLVELGVTHEKINTVGHVVPGKSVRQKFYEVADKFFAGNMTEGSLVGVHCTHGVNRTGFIVCRYLMDRIGLTADEAIAAFNEARGHELERENYLNELRNGKSHEDPEFVEPEAEEEAVRRERQDRRDRDRREERNNYDLERRIWLERRDIKDDRSDRRRSPLNDRRYDRDWRSPDRPKNYYNGLSRFRGTKRDKTDDPYEERRSDRRGHPRGTGPNFMRDQGRINTWRREGHGKYRDDGYKGGDGRSSNSWSREGIPAPYLAQSGWGGGYNQGPGGYYGNSHPGGYGGGSHHSHYGNNTAWNQYQGHWNAARPADPRNFAQQPVNESSYGPTDRGNTSQQSTNNYMGFVSGSNESVQNSGYGTQNSVQTNDDKSSVQVNSVGSDCTGVGNSESVQNSGYGTQNSVQTNDDKSSVQVNSVGSDCTGVGNSEPNVSQVADRTAHIQSYGAGSNCDPSPDGAFTQIPSESTSNLS